LWAFLFLKGLKGAKLSLFSAFILKRLPDIFKNDIIVLLYKDFKK